MHGRNRYRVRHTASAVALALSLVGSLAIASTPASAAEGTNRPGAPRSGSPPAGTRSAASSPATDGGDRSGKALSPGSVRIDAARLASDGTIEVQADVDGTATGRVTVDASGAASVERYSEPVGPSGTAAELDASVRGRSALTATLTAVGTDGTPVRATDTVWTDTVGGHLVVSERGEQDLRLKVVDALTADGAVTSDQARSLRRAILGATSARSVVTPSACAQVCVHGTVRWTDSAGGTHPVRQAPVQIRDREANPAADVVVATVTTDDNGNFATVVDNNDGPGENGRDLYARVRASGPGFDINQYIESTPDTDVATGSDVTVDLTANRTDDNNTAFSVQAALVVANEYLVRIHGSRFGDFTVDYPTADATSYFAGNQLHILRLDRWDWDVILHEYGHYVARQLNIGNNPGGSHSTNENLSTTRGKDVGTRLAFGEGWPTYFSVSAQQVMGTASLAIPNVGDTRYTDTEDASIDIDIEAGSTTGEDNEITVAGVLWDLYDNVDDGIDRVALGDQVVWNRLDGADPVRLSAAYAALAPANASDEGVNCVFTQANVAPTLAPPARVTVGRGASSPRLSWIPGNGGSFANNTFVVEYRSRTNTLLHTSPLTTATTYAAAPSTWSDITARSGGTINVTVVGRQTSAPATGPYRSCVKQFLSAGADDPPPVSPSADPFVRASYADFLRRPPTAAEVREGIARLGATGAAARHDFVDDLANSTEWVTTIVEQMYADTLGRTSDPGGLSYWTRQIQSGRRSVALVASAIYASDEYYRNTGGTDATWVEDLYRKLLLRPADSGGRAYWTARAAQGRTAVAYRFFQSHESRVTRVEKLYDRLLGRAPDVSGREYWARRIEGQGDIALAANLATSNEYLTRAVLRYG